jgi:galactose mutarotase-like enzyme
MFEATTISEGIVHELRALAIENDLIRVVVLPEAGAKVWQIRYKPLGCDLLWNSPGVNPARQPLNASYDDKWSGGWDELFPNDEAGTVLDRALPDHGELWTAEWEAEPLERDGEAGVALKCTTPVTEFRAEKTIRLRPRSATLEVSYRLTNAGDRPFPFLFKLHPAFAVSAEHRIDFPAMTVVREPEFPGTLDGAPVSFPWPFAQTGKGRLDLRQVPGVDSRAVHFFYGTGFAEGWCGVTDRNKRLAAALRFDPVVFSSCWLFATHGGWRDLNVAVLEPATGYPFNMQSMIGQGRARVLAPGHSLETQVLFSVQEGLTSIGGVDESGRIRSADRE